jgi:nitrate/nitrite-specific signal transduction histidine kinase
MKSSIMQSGRDGHWGLPGMRERAKNIGARFELWSEVGAGTEIEVIIRAAIAYQNRRISDDRKEML